MASHATSPARAAVWRCADDAARRYGKRMRRGMRRGARGIFMLSSVRASLVSATAKGRQNLDARQRQPSCKNGCSVLAICRTLGPRQRLRAAAGTMRFILRARGSCDCPGTTNSNAQQREPTAHANNPSSRHHAGCYPTDEPITTTPIADSRRLPMSSSTVA